MSTLDDSTAPGAGLAATGLERRGLRLGDTLFRGIALAAWITLIHVSRRSTRES